MITTKRLYEKTYEEMMEEALKQIPLYTEEWTNFNPSDPGITVLENLSSFNELQQLYIDTVTAQIQEKLLGLAGFARKPGGISRVLLECPALQEPRVIPANQRFLLGGLSFETNRAMELYGYTINGIFAQCDGQLNDYTFLTDPEIPLSALVFGRSPKAGDQIYIVCSGLPRTNEETTFYFRIADGHSRNPFRRSEGGVDRFASIQWECYTAEGYREIHCKDSTGCFAVNGEIRFRMPDTEPALCKELPVHGYVLRGTLVSSRYDIPPRLMAVRGFLFDVWQKETLSICNTFNKFTMVEMACDLLEEGYISVFCREEKGLSYRRYQELPDPDAKGRYYVRERESFGRYNFFFDRKKYRFGPARVKNAIKIVVYNEFIMRRYHLGTVMGYDNQEIDLPISNLVPETFSIIAERTDANGEQLYDFVKPNRMDEDALTFTIDENMGKITILDAGAFIEARLFLCACAITSGPDGNICENNTFQAVGFPEDMVFTNPGPGTGGAFRESLEDVRKRFVEDVGTAATAVTAADYEALVRATPGLCIDKVHAFADVRKHQVYVVVKPASEDMFARISGDYMEAIRGQIETGRLIGTKVKILQPVYAAIDVTGVIHIKPHLDKVRERIEAVTQQFLAYNTSNRNFGEILRFDELFGLLEELDCVEYVAELSMRPQNMNHAAMQSLDIKPMDHCLCYPGKLSFELIIGHR